MSSNKVKTRHLDFVQAKLVKANIRWGQPSTAASW